MNYYFGWQLNMQNRNQSISDALQRYYDKFGLPPHIIEVSDQLKEYKLPEGLQLIVNVAHIPMNVLLIGDGNSSSGAEES